MPKLRVLTESGVYHCVSRVNGRQFLLDPPHVREMLVEKIRRYGEFCAMEVLAYCVMGNHFHVLVREAPVEALSDGALVEKLGLIYDARQVADIAKRLRGYREAGREKEAAALVESFRFRMGHVSGFMKELKQNFSIWYNRHFDRFGTLWEERFRSVAVEDSAAAIQTIAGYIDLNPVRAGMVEDPKDYRWSSYGAACGGDAFAQRSVRLVHNCAMEGGCGDDDWPVVASAYRAMLYDQGSRSGNPAFSGADAERVLREGGKLTWAQALRCRVRHLIDGVAIGSEAFVRSVVAQNAGRFSGTRRPRGAPMVGAEFRGLYSLRRLNKDTLTNPLPAGDRTRPTQAE